MSNKDCQGAEEHRGPFACCVVHAMGSSRRYPLQLPNEACLYPNLPKETLVVGIPDLARSFVDGRFKLLGIQFAKRICQVCLNETSGVVAARQE